MAKKTVAGKLFERVAFESQDSASDGFGGRLTQWVERFSRAAAYHHLRGGETVLAARLENRHPQVITVRRCSETIRVSSEWRIRDTRTGAVFAIKDVEPETNRAYISFLCEKGIAA